VPPCRDRSIVYIIMYIMYIMLNARMSVAPELALKGVAIRMRIPNADVVDKLCNYFNCR
jgi:hypothetical protein